MRFEYKYIIAPEVLPALRRMMTPFIRFDTYSEREVVREYTVRSIYYDDSELNYYREKLAGLKNRKKLRIRGYGGVAEEDTRVFLEIKRKVENAVSKNRAPVLFREVDDILRTGSVERYISDSDEYPHARDDARRFLYHFLGKTLRPMALVVYEREAYFGKFDSTLRITVDKNLRSAIFPSSEGLFSEDSMLRSGTESFILEVKFHGWFPSWLAEILRALRLRRQSFSKYCSCVDDHLAKNRLILRDIHLLPTHSFCSRGRLS